MLRAALALVLFSIAFGYVEAAVVVYLRHISDPLRQTLAPGELFPLIAPERLSPEHLRLLAVELGREAATLLMLAGAGLLAARRGGQWMAGFVIAFGVWDLTFYLFLKLLLDWPASLWTWDILFLIPVPWAAPVLAPVLVSVVMAVCGFLALARDWSDHPIAASWLHWTGWIAGALGIIVSFTWDWRMLLAGASPREFHWILFAAGLLTGMVTFVHAWRR